MVSGSGNAAAAFRRVPVEKPPFTLSQLKKAIPRHCFHRSALRSFSYLLADLLPCSILFLLAIHVIPSIPSTPLRLAVWPLYWFAQGMALGPVWVIGHECGHHAFSEWSLLDDIVGFVLHSFLYVPYFSWKYSHRRHHSRTASLDGDSVYVPKRKSELSWLSKYLNNPFGTLFTISYYTLTGWPLYLFFNTTGGYFHFPSHFDPYNPMFSRRERAYVLISDAGILAVSFLLYRLAATFSVWWVISIYGVPLFVLYISFVIITFLHHTHPALPHYDSDEWDYLRGALSTVDRDYGVVLNRLSHNITNTHVLHHLFSAIPHYHAVEATNSIKPLLGDYYLYDNTPFWCALWREFRHCFFVQPDLTTAGDTKKGVYWFTNKL